MIPKILLVSLGGTITMVQSAGGGIAPTLSGEDLVGAVPSLAAVAEIEVRTPLSLPGASLSLTQLRQVARMLNEQLAGEFSGAVVVQGTDTIEETAYIFDLLVDSDKPVVVLGAMRGAQAAGADGPANLLAGVTAAASEHTRNLGTLVVLNDTIHAARFVQKTSTVLPSAFQSPNAGPLGYVVEGEVRLLTRIQRRPALPNGVEAADKPVALLTISLGEDGRLLSHLSGLGYAGVVIEAMGAGHVPASIVPALEQLADAIPVVLSTRVLSGPVFSSTYGFAGSEIDLLGRGLINGGSIGSLKARLLLSLLLGAGCPINALAERFVQYARD